jgi:glycosyltransferase involved in cell wall biosynthesis
MEKILLTGAKSIYRLLSMYHIQSNKGAPSASNYGINMSRAEYIQFLDSDDLMHPIKIYEQVKALDNTNFDVAVCDFKFRSNKKKHSNIGILFNSGDLHKKVIKLW